MDDELKPGRDPIEEAIQALEQRAARRKRGTRTLPELKVGNPGGEPPSAAPPAVRKRRGGPPKGSPAPMAAGVALPLPAGNDETTLARASRSGRTKDIPGRDVSTILLELDAERSQIEEAIRSLERLGLGRKRGTRGRPKGRGNPPDGNPPPLPPCAAMLLPRSRCQILWAVSGPQKLA